MSEEGMALARRYDILIPIKHTPDWPTNLVRCTSDDTRKLDRACLLPSKAATHTLHPTDNFISIDTDDLGYVGLRFSRVLRATEDFHLSILWLGNSKTSLRFEIEVLLAAHTCDTREDVI